MITRRAWLRRYSINNTMLILLQRPDATDVRPIKEWNKAGRRVRKGERGIRILAPCRYRARDDDGNPVTDDDGAPLYRVRTFKVVSVFDVSQTDGDPLPEPETGLVPAELRGAARSTCGPASPTRSANRATRWNAATAGPPTASPTSLTGACGCAMPSTTPKRPRR
ncbi:ArdC family protein [Nocardiopsis composta]